MRHSPSLPRQLTPTAGTVQDRALGAFIGLAIGDALGATLEFMPYDPLRYNSEMVGGGPFDVRPGEWTDDTAMALALADALLSDAAFSPAGLMTRLADWFEYGSFSCQGRCIDIGRGTLAAIRRFIATGTPTSTDHDPSGAGNGSLVRLAPVALRYLHAGMVAERIAREQSRCTHAAPAAADACAFLVQRLRELILSSTDDTTLRSLPPGFDSEIAQIAAGSYLELRHPKPTGHVARTLETALWAVARTESFEAALITATSLGGDADSIGAVCGMLAGATYGLSAIPERWLRRLVWRQRILRTGHELLSSADSLRPAINNLKLPNSAD